MFRLIRIHIRWLRSHARRLPHRYIINGDMTGLTDEEIRMIDEWQSKWNVQIVSPLTDEEGNAQPYFSRYPLFGLPSEVEDCDILYTNDNI